MKMHLPPCVRRKNHRKLTRFARNRILSGSAALLAAASQLIFTPSANAVSAAWTGAGLDSLWGNILNWSVNPVPGAGDTATFNAAAGAGGTVITTGNISLGTLVFDTASAAAYAIGGATPGTGTITFGDGTTNIVTMNSTVTANELINANIILGTAIASNSTITNASTTNTLTIAGSITGGTGGTAAAKILTIAGAGQTIISGNITKGGATTLTITDTATGTLTLSGTNSITTLNATQAGAVINLGSGTTTISNVGASTVLFSAGGTLNGGTIFLNAGTAGTATAIGNYGDFGAAAGTLTVNSVIAGSAGIGVDFFPVAGTVILKGLNIYSGPSDIYGNVSVSSIGNVGVAGNLGTAATLGTNAGAISIGSTTAASKLTYTGTGEQTNRTLALSGTTGTATIDISGTGILHFTSGAAIISPGAGAKTLILTGSTAGAGRLDMIIQNATNGGGLVSVSKTGTGIWVLGGANTYGGTTSIAGGGNLVFTKAQTLAGNVTWNNSGLTYAASTDAPLNFSGTLTGTGGATATLGGSIGSTATSAQILVSGNATATAAALTVNLFGISGVTPLAGTNTYTLLHSSGASPTLNLFTPLTLGRVLNNTNWVVGGLTNTTADLRVSITSASALTSAFWNGGFAGAPNVWAVSDGTAASNWFTSVGGGATGVVPGTLTDVTISAATPALAPTATFLGANMAVKSLTIADTVNGLGLNNDGFTLTIAPAASATGLTINAGVPAVTINANLATGAAQTWTNNSANALNIGGLVGGTGALTITNGGPVNLTNIVSTSALITKAGTGSLTLSGPNTFTGGLTLSGGTLNINNATALGATGSTFTIGAAATLDNTTGAAITMTANNPIALNSSFTFAGGTGTTHDLNFGTGAVTFGTSPTITVNNASTLAFGGTGAMGVNVLTKAGPGTVVFSGVLSGSVANGSNSVALTAGTLSVTGVNSSFSGNITVDGAGSILSMTGSNGSVTGGPLGFIVGGTTTPGFKTITLSNGGIFRVTSTYNDNVPTAALPANGYVFVMGTGGGVFDVPSGVTLTIDDGTGTGTATTASELQGSGNLTKTGLGTLSQDDSTAYAGTITVQAGSLQPASANAFGVAANGTLIMSGAQLNVNGITMTNAEVLTINGTGLAAAPQGALTNSSATAATWAGPITLGSASTIGLSAAGGLTLSATATVALAGNNLTISITGAGNVTGSGVISSTGGGGVFVTGSSTGAWVPSALNTYTGGTTLTSGVAIPAISSVGPAGTPTSGPFGAGAVPLTLAGSAMRSSTTASFTVGNTITISGDTTFLTAATEKPLIFSGPVTLSGGNRTLTSTVGTTVAGTSAFFNGIIGDGGNALGIIKAGTGNLTLTAANSYTGPTVVNAGILFLTGSLASNSALTVAGGGSLNLQNNAVNPISNISALSLGTAATTASLAFDLGANTAVSDFLASPNAATSAGTVALNFNAMGGFGTSSTYDLISAASGLNNATYVLGGSVAGGFTYSVNATSSLVRLILTPAAAGGVYWRGLLSGSWSSFSAGTTNWTTNAAGTLNAGFTPGAANTVIFSAVNATGPAIATTLDGNFTINDLQFTSAPAGVTSVTIGNGTFGTNSLTIAPSSSSVGITLAQNSGLVTISAPFVIGASQTWSLDASGATPTSLSLSGGISGGTSSSLALVATGGAPVVTLTGTNSYTGTTTVGLGVTLQGGAATALPNSSAITVNGTLATGAFAQTIGSLAGGNGIVQNGSATNAILSLGNDTTNQSAGVTLQNGSTGTLAITKLGNAIQTLTGTYSYTGATTVNLGTLRLSGTSTGSTAVMVNAGTLQFGSATALTSLNNVTLAGTGVLDLFGSSVTIGSLTTAATNTITNSSSGTGASTATTPGTPSGAGIFVDALTVNTAIAANIAALVTDGATRKTQIVISNANAGIANFANLGNTFSGGIVLANSAAGTRLDVTVATILPALGSGPIIIGQAATDKAGLFFPVTATMANPVVFNTALGTDRVGIRADAAITLSGVITANLAPATFTSNATTTGSVALTNQVTGPNGFVLDIVSLAAAATSFTVTLNNATANPNNYAGDTVVNFNATTGKSATLTLAQAGQIPNGPGSGNVIINTNGTGVGLLNLGGFAETINGLLGNGTVDGTSGTPTFTLGDNNATAAFSGIIRNTAGTLTLAKIGGGTQTLSGVSTFTGPVNVSDGLVAFATSPATSGPLGNSTVVNLNGGGISYTAAGANALNRPVAIGAGGGTVNVASSTGTLTISAVTSTGGNLIKAGPGVAQLTNPTALNGGVAGVVVTGGILQGGFGTGGIGTINIGGQGYLSLQNSVAEVLTLGGSGSLALASGAQLGFELGIPGTSDQVVYNTATVAGGAFISLNFFNLGGLAGGTYTLLSSLNIGGLAGVNFVLGSAPNGFNYTINNDGTVVSLNTLASTPIYWNNTQGDGSWANVTGNLGSIGGGAGTNFTSNFAGTIDAGHAPLVTETVIFNTTAVAGPAITTTLDGSVTVDSLQFNGAGAPTVTSVTINQGTGGTLTLKPQSASGGIFIAAGGGNATINAPLALDNTLSPSQAWNVTDPASTLNIAGNVTFGANVTKGGAGVLTLSGNNTGTGSITLNGGKLNINNGTAFGGGTVSINAGTAIDSTLGGGTTLTANNPFNWNGDFTFAGTNSLNLGPGSVTLGNTVTVTTSASSLTVGGAIGGGNGLLKAGVGTLVLNGNNTYSGATVVNAGILTLAGNNTASGGVTLNAGTLNINSAGALGSGTFAIFGGTIDNMSGGVTSNAVPTNIAANFTFAGTNSINLGTGAISLTATPAITTTANTLTLAGNISGGFGITKAGAGALTLAGTDTYTGITTVNAGVLNVTGSLTSLILGNIVVNGGGILNQSGTISGNANSTLLNYGATAGNAVVNVTGGTMTLFATSGSGIANAVSIYNQSGGTVNITPGVGTGTQNIAKAVNSYGYFNLTGGTFRDSTGTAGGARFTVSSTGGTGSALTGTGTPNAVIYVGGTGFLDHTNAEWWLNYGLGQITVADSGKIDHTGSNQPFGIFMDTAITSESYGVLNVAGSGAQAIIGAQPIRFGNSTVNGAGNSGFINVAAGTLSVGAIVTSSLPAAPTTINNAYFNFSGGTVKATASLAGWIPPSTASINYNVNVYGPINNSAVAGAPSFSGGVTFDTNSFNITLANPLQTPGGAGVTQADLTVSGGSGYLGAPAVIFSSAGVVAGGAPAAGYAIISGGTLVGIVITDPGTYTAGTVPTVTLIGGGATTPATVTSTALNTGNISGGVTKVGTGSLIFTGANTYAGTTTVNGGTLQMGNAGVVGTLATSSPIVVTGTGTFAVSRTDTVTQGTQFSGAPITGSGVFQQAGTGTTILLAANAYGNTVVSAGTLQIDTGGTTATLGTGAVSNAGTLVFNRTNTYTLAPGNIFTGAGAITLANTGTVAAVVDGQFNTTGVLNLGTAGATTVASLDIQGSSTFGSLVVQTNTASANIINIATGKTMTVTGGAVAVVSIGSNAGANSNSALTFTGGGNLVVSRSGGTFQIGAATGATSSDAVAVDMGALTNFTADLGATGVFRIGYIATSSQPSVTFLTGATNNTITAGTFGLADSTGAGAGAKTFTLGSGINIINANTINIGETATNRGSGSVQFAGAGGSLQIRSATGTPSVANLTMVNNASATATQLVAQLLLAGHAADISLNNVVMSARSAGTTQGSDATISFDTGTFTANTVAMVARTGTTLTTGVSTGTINIGGGTANLGAVTMAVNSATTAGGSAGTATATLNISGGNVTSSSVNMANAVSTGSVKTATGNINLTGGTLTLAGNITRTGGTGTENAAVTLNGPTAALDMGGFAIGGAAAVSLNAQQGTLRNLGQLNSGGALTKTSANTLTLAGTNAYTGATTISQGTLKLGGANVIPDGATAGNVSFNPTSSDTATLDLNGFNETVNGLTSGGTGTSVIDNLAAGNPVLTLGGNNQTATYAGSIQNTAGTVGITKIGAGIEVLSGATLTYTGATTVNAGTLSITGSAGAPLPTGGITVAGGGTLLLNNNVGQAISVGALSLGSAGGTAALGLELGANSAASDRIAASGAAVTSNTVAFNIIGLAGFGAGTYDLLTATAGLDGATYSVGSISGTAAGLTLTISSTPTLVQLVSDVSGVKFFWRGAANNSWAGFSGGNSNWTSDLAGTLNISGTPGVLSTVNFSANGATTAIATTLDAGFTINSLKLLSNPTGVTSVSIAAGTGGTLTLAPATFGDGIDVADNAGAIAITAPIILGASQTWSVAGTGANSSSLAISGGISGGAANGLAKAGAGTLTLSGTNTYSGATSILAGLLLANSAGTLSPNSTVTVDGTGILSAGLANAFNANAGIVSNNTGIVRLNGFSNAISTLGGNGFVENGSAATAATLTVGSSASSTFAGTIQNGAAAALAITKTGTGTLTLSGAVNHTGGITVNAGTLVAAGSSTATGNITVGNATSNAVLNVVTGGMITGGIVTVGTAAGSFGAVNVTGGTMIMATPETTDTIAFGAANGGYGALTVTGGTFTQARFMLGGTSGTSGTGGIGVGLITGGVVNTNGYIILGRRGASVGILTITGGTINHTAASQNLYVGFQDSGRGELNVAGGLIDNTGRSVTFGGFATYTGTGIVNLNAGTLLTNSVTIAQPGTSSWNFNGGTLKSASSTATFFPALTSVYVNGGFGSYAGGAVIDTNGFNDTVSAPLLAPAGSGVRSLSISASGSGYIGAPQVQITGDGTGATGYAVVDTDSTSGTFGQVTSIVVTNPGVGYTTAGVTLIGGGSTNATATATLGANTSGALTKIGAGTLTLSGNNTYTGGTNVNVGTLALGASDILANTGNVTINGGTFDAATFNDTVATVILQGGTITGSTGVLTSTADFDLRSGSVNFTGAGGLAGSVGATKTTGGTVTLGSANTFSGPVNVNGGALVFSNGNQLGNAATTNTIGFNGGTLSYTGSGPMDLGGTRVVTVSSGGATFDVFSLSGVLTASGGASGAGGNLTKTGLGQVIISGSTNLGTGTVTVSGGILRAGFGTGGTIAINVSAMGNLNMQNAATEVLTLGNSAGALTLAGGAMLGFELNGAANDKINVGATGSALTTLGTITLNFFSTGSGVAASTYDLLTAPSGLLPAGVNYVLGSAPSGFNYLINQSDTLVSLTTTVLSNRYWTGQRAGVSWATMAGPLTNWSSTADGLTDPGTVPGVVDTVIFSADNAPFTSGTVIATTLDQPFTIDSLRFRSVPASVTAVTIDSGIGGAASTLKLAPVGFSNGITVDANGGAVTVNAPLIAAAPQTWSVDGTGASSLTLAGSVTFTNAVTKVGAGSLTLNGSNSGAGGLTLAGGTLNLGNAGALGTGTFSVNVGTTFTNSTAGALILSTNNAQNWNGDFTFGGTQNLDLGTGAVALKANVTATVSNTLTVGGAIDDGASTFALTKDGAGTLVLNGANGYDGVTTVSTGALTLAGDNSGAAGGVTLAGGTLNLAHAAALGTGTFVITSGTIDNTLGAPLALTTANAQNWNGSFTFTGSSALDLGTGPVALGASVTVTTAAGNLTVSGAMTGALAASLTKAGPGTLTLAGLSSVAVNNYLGTTILEAGTAAITSATTAALSGGLTFGSASGNATSATLDLTGANVTFTGALLTQHNSIAGDTIIVGSGKTLAVNGNWQIGATTPIAAGATSKLAIGGGGNLTVTTAAAGTFRVGGSTSASLAVSEHSILDLTGLATANINVSSTGTFAVAQPSGTNVIGDDASLLLPTPSVTAGTAVTTITAANFNVGDSVGNGGGAGQVNAATLGTGLTTLNVNTVNVGTGGRDLGQITYSAGNGTLVLRGAAGGTTRAVINIGTGGATTGVAAGAGVTNNVDFTGHSVDILVSTLNIGTQNRSNAYTNSFSFDSGTLDITSVTAATRTTETTANGINNARVTSATINLGGGTVNIGNGILQFGDLAGNYVTATQPATENATLNISGGIVTIGATAGTSITMAKLNSGTSTAATTVNAQINITGGTTTLSGNIVKGTTTGSGTTSNVATLTLNGASAVLDMGGKNIGDATNPIVFNAQSGTLQNIAQLNGGGALTKTTAGTLSMFGSNTYSGATNINAGTVIANTVSVGATAQSLGIGTVVNLGVVGTSSGVLNYTGAGGTMDKNINALGNGTDTIRNSGTGTLTLAGTLTKNGTVLTLQAATAKINVTGPIVGALPNSDLNVTGNQTTTVANNNTYNGATVVGTGNAGENSTLAVTGSLSGTTAVTVNSGSVLLLNSSATTLPAASNIVKASATFTTSAGAGTNAGDARLTVGNTTPGITNTFGQMTLNANTTVDFGAGSNNSRLQFANLEGGGTVQSGTALALFNGTTKLTINNWTGATYPLGATSDPGVAAGSPYDTQDRLLFNSDPGFAPGVPIAGIDFTGLGAGIEVSFGSQFEIVPVPEPAANVLIGSVALCALIGYRHRRRATGIRGGVRRG